MILRSYVMLCSSDVFAELSMAKFVSVAVTLTFCENYRLR